MTNTEHPLDPFQTLSRHAAHFNALQKPAASPQVFFDVLAGGLMWSDEMAEDTPLEAVRALRLLIAYRAGLMLDEPREEYRALWEHALGLFPQWVGFHPERRRPSPELLEAHRRGTVAMRQSLRDIEREKGRPAGET